VKSSIDIGRFLQFILLLLLLQVAGNAQIRETALQGQIVDAAGAAMSGVRLLVVNLDSLEEQRLVVKGNGKFLLPQMNPGDYMVIAAASRDSPCFRSAVERVRLETDTTRSVRMVMIAIPGGCSGQQ
jgi:hypothetical protein